MKRALKILMVFLMVVNSCLVVSAEGTRVLDPEGNEVILLPPTTVDTSALPDEPAPVKMAMATATASLDTDPDAYWDQRHTFEELEALYESLANEYPTFVKKYSIGHTWRERNIWCLEITAPNGKEGKTPVSIMANIHGGEQESAECASYTAWWFLKNYGTDQDATQALDNYIIYFVPVINADGYAQSTKTGVSTRQNQRPTDREETIKDANGNPAKDEWGRTVTIFDNIAFNDPYRDINGDGFIGQIYEGENGTDIPNTSTARYIGYESPDRNNTGTTGSDPEHSTIDMNRTFDHMWHRYDVEAPNIGANTWANAGPQAASEPEVKAIQNFLNHTRPVALITGHTGIQCVLWPWCWTPEEPDDGGFHKRVGEKMAQAYSDTVVPVRGPNATYYAMQSNSDYPTSSELIDWAWARLGTHSYTVEVYSSGTGVDRWQNILPPTTWQYIGRLNSRNGSKITDHAWIRTTGSNQVSGRIAPPDQHIMAEGFKNATLVMLYSERPVEGFKATASTALGVGKTMTINPTFTPDTAADRKVIWVSSNPRVATVDEKGNVKALSAGSVTITGTTTDGGFTQKLAIRVM